MNRVLLRLVLIVACLAAIPCVRAQRERLTPDQIEYVEKTWPGTKKTSTGIRYLILKPGEGPLPQRGERVAMYYVGRLLDGKVFDQRQAPDAPLVFRLGRGEVIDGWDQIAAQMKPHEKRLVIIPSDLAYGSRGRAPVIPRDAPLVFEMELAEVKHD